MVRLLILAACVAAAAAGPVVVAQSQHGSEKNPYRNYTQEKFEENMKAAGRNYAAVTTFLGGSDYESAKAQLTRAREQLAITITFWRDRRKDDAVAMLRTALNGMDTLDMALGATPVVPETVRAAAEKVNAACTACHATYRDQDPVTKAYRLKPGSITP